MGPSAITFVQLGVVYALLQVHHQIGKALTFRVGHLFVSLEPSARGRFHLRCRFWAARDAHLEAFLDYLLFRVKFREVANALGGARLIVSSGAVVGTDDKQRC